MPLGLPVGILALQNPFFLCFGAEISPATARLLKKVLGRLHQRVGPCSARPRSSQLELQ